MAAAKNKALVVGIGKYSVKSGAQELLSVSNDVQAVKGMLSSKRNGFATDVVEVLLNRNAKKEQILKLLKSTLSAARTARVFVYLAGHGDMFEGEYYFLPFDANPDDLRSSAINLREVRELFEKTSSTQALLWLDFCHSGGILARKGIAPDSSELIERALKPIEGGDPGKCIIAACRENQSAYGDTKSDGHGLMTRALIEGIEGGAVVAGEITANSLYDFVDRAVENAAVQSQILQRPVQYVSQSGRIILMKETRGKAKSASKRNLTADRKQIKAVKKKATKTKRTQSQTGGSGSMVMIGRDLFVDTERVRTDNDGEIIVVLKSKSAELNSQLKDLRKPYQCQNEIWFAHGNEAALVDVVSTTSESDGDSTQWTLTLRPTPKRGYDFFPEMSISVGGKTYSADDVRCLKARKLLLNESFAERNSHRFDSIAMLGLDQLECAIIATSKQGGGVNSKFLIRARLACITALVEHRVVEHVHKLTLTMKKNAISVLLSGVAASAGYDNSSGKRIDISGDCLIE